MLHGFAFVGYVLYSAWLCVCILLGFVFVSCLVLCLYTSVIPKRGELDYQAKSTDVAKLAFRTVAPCSLTVCRRTHDDVFVTEVLDSVIFETLTLHLNFC